jgi:hypothetical protein
MNLIADTGGEVIRWVRGWNLCTWVGFLLVAAVVGGIVTEWLRAIFGTGPRRITRRVHCPKCGYDDARLVEEVKPIDED